MPVGFPTKVNYATGDVLSATNMNDLSGTVNLLESAAESAAGVNKIINGDFGIWQRGTSFTLSTSFAYTADRFGGSIDGTGVCTVSRQTFTPGTAPVAGYEGQFFLRSSKTAGTTNTYGGLQNQRIEDVRTFAGQTATLSFWAKADAANTMSAYVDQNFGSGGSASVSVLATTNYTLTTSWQRFTTTITFPSISGKTVGTSSYVDLGFFKTSAAAYVIDIWGVQLEAGSVASDFKTATGTKQGELAACQRYYWRAGGSALYQIIGLGYAFSSTKGIFPLYNPTTMRVAPTSVSFSTLQLTDYLGGDFAVTAATLASNGVTNSAVELTVASGLTNSRPMMIRTNNSLSGFIDFSAEL